MLRVSGRYKEYQATVCERYMKLKQHVTGVGAAGSKATGAKLNEVLVAFAFSAVAH